MDEKPTLLRLEFIKEPSLVLERTFFQCPESQARSETARNSINDNSFRWGKAPTAFSLLILDYLIWSASQDPRGFTFCGAGRYSAPATLYWLVRDKDEWLAKVFGTSKERTPLLYDILDREPRPPKDGSSLPYASIEIKLAPAVIEIVLGKRKLETELELRDLWEKIKASSTSHWTEEILLAVEKHRQPSVSPETPGNSITEIAKPLLTSRTGKGGEPSRDLGSSPEISNQEAPIAAIANDLQNGKLSASTAAGTGTRTESDPSPDSGAGVIDRESSPVRNEKQRLILKICSFLAAVALFGILLASRKGSTEDGAAILTAQEKQRISELASNFRGQQREIFKVFADLQQRLLQKDVIHHTTFEYSKVTYSVPLVYKGSLSPSPFFMRYDHESNSLIVENATVTFDKERTLLMPVESFGNNTPTEKTHHESLGKLKGLLADDVIRGAEAAHLIADAKAYFADHFQNVLTKELKPILPPGAKVQVLLR